MSGQLIGQAIGYYFGGPIGGMIGGMIGGALFPASDGPTLDDLKPQASEYGRPLPIVYGTVALGGNVIWADEFRIEEGGGKGGESPTGVTAYANFAVAICEGGTNIQLGRIWAGPEKRLIWDGVEVEGGATLTFYNGAEDQLPSPLIEAAEGAGQVPAFRGTAYITLENYNCLKDGNRLPFLWVEVGIIEENQAPADLGTFVPTQVIVTDDYYAVFYHGSFNGVVVRNLSDYRLRFHYTYADPDWDVGSPFFWDEDRERFVRPNVDGMTFTTLSMATGDLDNHNVTAAVGAEPNPATHLRGGVYHNGTYVFIADPGVAGERTTLYVMDPDTFLPVSTYTSDLNGDVQRVLMKPLDSAPWVYGVTAAGTIQKYALAAATAPVAIGAAAPGMEEGHIGVDPATGLIWSVAESAGTLSVNVNDPVTTNSLLSATTHAFTDTGFSQGMPLTFVDSDNGPRVLVFGEKFFATDWFVTFSSLSPFSVVDAGSGGTYHGTSELGLVFHDPVTGLLVGIREGGNVHYAYNTTPIGLRVLSPNPNGPGELFIPWPGPPLPASYIGARDGSLAPESQPLDEIVLDLSLRAGLTADQVNVTELADDMVDGYAVADQTTVRDAIATLMPAYYFDAVESEGVVKFVKRGAAAVRVIPDDEVGCFEAGSDPVEPIETFRRMENELPRTLNVRYILMNTDYAKAARSARRLVGASGEKRTIDFPLVMTDTKAQQVAETNLHGAWVARISYKFSLHRKHADLEPTDVITVYGYTMRLTKTLQRANGVIECEAEADIQSVWTPKVVVAETPPGGGAGGGSGGGVTVPVTTTMELLDISMLRDADDNPNFYAAAAALDINATWAGAGLYVSTDGGTTYTFLVSLTDEVTMGITTNAQGDFSGGNIPDELTSINVRLYHGSLSSTTNAGLLSGVNACIVGDEIEFFRTATLEADGTYTLRGLLRGRRGSEHAMNQHVVNDRFVLVNFATLTDVAQAAADVGQTRLYKAVSSGSTLTLTASQSFTNEGSRLKPYAPVHLGGGLEANGDWTLNWVRRTRKDGEWRDSVEVPLSEAVEAYEVEIWNSDFTTLKRTITGLSSASATYTSAQQTTDFGGAQTDVYFAVYQMSATVGRGHVAYGHVATTGVAAPAPPPAPAPSPPPPAPAPAPSVGTIAVANAPDTILQSNTVNGVAYWVVDNAWNPGNLTRGVYNGTTQFESYIGISYESGVDGETAYRQVWKWPLGTTEVKAYPSILYGEHPGWYSPWINPAGWDILLPDLTISQVYPSGPTPGTVLPLQLPLAPLNSSFDWEHVSAPTGSGHLSYDIWLQHTNDVQVNGFAASPIAWEIMIPLTYWADGMGPNGEGGYGHWEDRNPAWDTGIDVTIQGILFRVFWAPNFNGVWQFLVFQPRTPTTIVPGTLDLAPFINYPQTQGWDARDLWCMSVSLGVEPHVGTGDMIVKNFRVYP